MDRPKLSSVELNQVFTEQEAAMDYFSCEEAIVRLNDYLDHEMTSTEREVVMKHLKICQPCLERFGFEERLITKIKTRVEQFTAPKSLKERLKSLIHTPIH